jgi:hypothetical protein
METKMVATVRKATDASAIQVKPQAVAEMLKVLARHNPGLSKTALSATGKMMVVASAAAAKLSLQQQRQIVARERELESAMDMILADVAAKGRSGELAAVQTNKSVEVSTGAGIGKLLPLEEGRRRLAGYATPIRLEDWAGPVAGPTEIEKMFGIKRSTLHDWQKRGAVIGLLRGQRKHVFPLAQFVDGRPVEGMSQITSIISNPRVVWQWLIGSKPSIGGPPLDRLKAGEIDQVLAAAARDFS